jgi:hypothetical protein
MSTADPCFSSDVENWSEFVIRRYLEALWLPEVSYRPQLLVGTLLTSRQSLINLTLLVSSLRQVPSHSIPDSIFPLLKSARETQNKYHQELPKILAEQGGGGEVEESMMWYAWSHEKYAAPEGVDAEEHERQWRNKWLDKLEKRESVIHLKLVFRLTTFTGLRYKYCSTSSSLRPLLHLKQRRRSSPRQQNHHHAFYPRPQSHHPSPARHQLSEGRQTSMKRSQNLR